MTLTIALVAGEPSGDQLGADLITRLRAHHPEAIFVGIGGDNMKAAGMDTWWHSDELAVFGLFEVLGDLHRIWRIRKSLKKRLLAAQPDVFIGIDAPDFNLGLEIQLKSLGIKTVHYVSPTVWAWRAGRVRKIARAADLVLCLFPFEPDFYKTHNVKAVYVGHPLADQIDIQEPASTHPLADPLTNNLTNPVIALLPGSRASEVERLAEPMLSAAAELANSVPGIQFTAAMANQKARLIFESIQAAGTYPEVELIDQDAHSVIAAADVVILASGTATLETMLINRPMVVCYRVSAPTAILARVLKLLKTRFVSLPNILADQALVPELTQDGANASNLAAETMHWLNHPDHRETLFHHFTLLHQQLRQNAGEKAAEQVSALLKKK
jgi:lipid-A-disaccharide synthase